MSVQVYIYAELSRFVSYCGFVYRQERVTVCGVVVDRLAESILVGGWRFFSDDVTVLNFERPQLRAQIRVKKILILYSDVH